MSSRDYPENAALKERFAEGAKWLGAGLRGPDLGARFRAALDAVADRFLEELGELVQSAVRRAGLAAWPGARLGAGYMDLARLDDPEATRRLTLELVVTHELELEDADAADGLGWLGGRLFRGGRLLGYLKAAEEDPEKALAYLRKNIARELHRMRAAADPAGAALFDNLEAAAAQACTVDTSAAREIAQRMDVAAPEQPPAPVVAKAELVLTRTAGPVVAALDSETLHAEAVRERRALTPLVEAAERNAARPEGTRNLVMRGPAFVDPLCDHFVAWGASAPPDPACSAVHVGQLANALRCELVQQAELLEVAMPTDDEGNTLVLAAARTWVDAGHDALAELMDGWRAALAAAPKLSEARRTKLAAILDAVAARFTGGAFQELDLAAVRIELGIKPQTFSDDWKLLRELAAVEIPGEIR